MFSGDWDSGVPDDDVVVADVAAIIRNLKRDFRERINAFKPIGAIEEWDTETLPDGWLECNGQSVAVASCYSLFLVLGYRYGGSGANFNLPDLRGIFIRCLPHGVQGRDLDCYTRIPTTGNTTRNSAVITAIPSTATLRAGMDISGTNIPSGSKILTVDSTTRITMDHSMADVAASTQTGVALVFTHLSVFGKGDISGTAVTNVTEMVVCPRLGAEITGTGIPAGTTISAIPSFSSEGIPTALTLSQAATAGTDIALTINNDIIGTFGYDVNKTHSHTYSSERDTNGANIVVALVNAKKNTTSSGTTEMRPKNNACMYIIRADEI